EPVDVTGLSSDVSAIAAGGAHTCAVTAAGVAKCWGASSWGQLGVVSPFDHDAPTDVDGGFAGRVFGRAVFTISTLEPGSRAIFARHDDDANYDASTSPAKGLDVQGKPTSLSFGAAPNPSLFGQSVAFTATVTSVHGTPTGTVGFWNGVTHLGDSTLAGNTAT